MNPSYIAQYDRTTGASPRARTSSLWGPLNALQANALPLLALSPIPDPRLGKTDLCACRGGTPRYRPYQTGGTKWDGDLKGSSIPSAHGSLIREASGVWSAEVNERRRSKEGTARRRRGTYLPYLRAVRTSRMLSQQRLSALSGVSRESIYRLEGGRRGAMPDTLWKLARALWVSPEDLIYGRP